MNEELYTQVWGEPPPRKELEDAPAPSLPEGDMVTTIRKHLADLKDSQEHIAKLSKDLSSIEEDLHSALQALIEAGSPPTTVSDKVVGRTRGTKSQRNPA